MSTSLQLPHRCWSTKEFRVRICKVRRSRGWQRPLILQLFGFHDRHSWEICQSFENCSDQSLNGMGTTTTTLSSQQFDTIYEVNSLLVLLVIAFFAVTNFFAAAMWSFCFPFFWSCVCHYMRFTTLRRRSMNVDCSSMPDFSLTSAGHKNRGWSAWGLIYVAFLDRSLKQVPQREVWFQNCSSI